METAFSYFKRGLVWLGWITQRSGMVRILAGAVLVILGIMTFYSGTYWEKSRIEIQL